MSAKPVNMFSGVNRIQKEPEIAWTTLKALNICVETD